MYLFETTKENYTLDDRTALPSSRSASAIEHQKIGCSNLRCCASQSKTVSRSEALNPGPHSLWRHWPTIQGENICCQTCDMRCGHRCTTHGVLEVEISHLSWHSGGCQYGAAKNQLNRLHHREVDIDSDKLQAILLISIAGNLPTSISFLMSYKR